LRKDDFFGKIARSVRTLDFAENPSAYLRGIPEKSCRAGAFGEASEGGALRRNNLQSAPRVFFREQLDKSPLP